MFPASRARAGNIPDHRRHVAERGHGHRKRRCRQGRSEYRQVRSNAVRRPRKQYLAERSRGTAAAGAQRLADEERGVESCSARPRQPFQGENVSALLPRKPPHNAEFCAAAVKGAQVDAEMLRRAQLVAAAAFQRAQDDIALRAGQRKLQRFPGGGAEFSLSLSLSLSLSWGKEETPSRAGEMNWACPVAR